MIMKSRTFFILVFIFLVSLGCFSCKTTATDDFSIDSEIAYCRSQAMRTLVSIPSLDEVTKIVYFIGNEHMLIAHDSNRLRFS